MQFVEHNAPERAEHVRRIGAREQQRKLLRRGEQDVGRIPALALAFGCGRVAGARFEPDSQAHLLHRNFQVARNVDRKRLQRRNVQSVQALRAHQRASGRSQVARPHIALAQLDERRQEACERLAAAGRRDQAALTALPSLSPASRADAHAAASPGLRTSAQRRPAAGALCRRDRARVPSFQCVANTISPGTGTPFSMRVEAEARLTGFRPAAATARCT